MSKEYMGPVKVTVSRLDTGETLKEQTVSDDYLIICNGRRYVKSYQMWGKTHQVNIGVRDLSAPTGNVPNGGKDG